MENDAVVVVVFSVDGEVFDSFWTFVAVESDVDVAVCGVNDGGFGDAIFFGFFREGSNSSEKK